MEAFNRAECFIHLETACRSNNIGVSTWRGERPSADYRRLERRHFPEVQLPQEIIRTERHMNGNKAVQKTTYSDGQAEATGGMIILGLVVLVILSPFAVLLWFMYQTVASLNQAGIVPLVGVLLASIEAVSIVSLFILFRLFRYMYLFMNAIVIASLTYSAVSNHGENANFASVLAAILFLVALIGGFIGERHLDRAGLSGIFEELRNL